MKSKLLIPAIASLSLIFSASAFAGCGGGYCNNDNGGCSVSEYENVCQCTDPVCNSSDRGCLSKAECCEAFGNMGAR